MAHECEYWRYPRRIGWDAGCGIVVVDMVDRCGLRFMAVPKGTPEVLGLSVCNGDGIGKAPPRRKREVCVGKVQLAFARLPKVVRRRL